CKPSDLDSSEPAISSLTVLRSWLGDAVILMPPSGMLPLIILALFCEAFVCIRSSVEVQDCLSFSCFRLPIHTMPLLRNAYWQEPCTSIASVPVLFAWMLPIGACASSPGFMLCWVPWRLCLGIPKT